MFMIWCFMLCVVLFYDGSLVMVQDVEWILQQIQVDGLGIYMYDVLCLIIGVEIIDDRSFCLMIDGLLVIVFVLMIYLFLLILKVGLIDVEDQGIGVGFYCIVYVEKGVVIEFELNEYYFKFGLFVLLGVIVIFYVDESVWVVVLMVGDVDLIDYVLWLVMQVIDGDSVLVLYKVDVGVFMYFSFNGIGVFVDFCVWQVVVFGLWCDEFVQLIFFGFGVEMKGLLCVFGIFYYYDDQVNFWGYDLECVKVFLKEVGYEGGLQVNLLLIL